MDPKLNCIRKPRPYGRGFNYFKVGFYSVTKEKHGFSAFGKLTYNRFNFHRTGRSKGFKLTSETLVNSIVNLSCSCIHKGAD